MVISANSAGRRALAALLVLAVCAGCSRVETPKVTPVITTWRVSADGLTLPLLKALTAAYTDLRPTTDFKVQMAGSQATLDALYAGQADIGSVSLLPAVAPGQTAPWVSDLAIDGVVVIVNPRNPIDNLQMGEARDLFAGVRTSWTDFGIAELGDIDAGVREEGDATRSTFDERLMDGTRLGLSCIVLPSVEVAMNFVAYQPNAIAYVPRARITDTVAPAVKMIGIDGALPTPENIATGKYKLSRTLNMIAVSEPQGELRQFVAWALGREGQAIVGAMNYVQLTQAQP